ncbi:MAG: formylglycine-generating enzyme family protein [Anaerolineae bacterium]
MKRIWILFVVSSIALTGCLAPTPTLIPTPTPIPSATATATTIPPTVPAPTATPTLRPTRTPNPTAQGITTVETNAEWTPIIQEFGGVLMALVPAGSFTMGRTIGDTDEFPLTEICFETPFWIAVTEVTNAAFGSNGFLGGPDRPRDNVTLPEATAHCEARGGRLPTEAEWEYAARGPDSWVYPWGNEFVVEHSIFVGNSDGESAAVGTASGGVSWVGALDMGGNLWEWTTTIYDEDRYPYPYDPTDGREDRSDENSYRAIRGGAFSTDPSFVRATSRKEKHPTLEWYGYVGFRCVMDIEP